MKSLLKKIVELALVVVLALIVFGVKAITDRQPASFAPAQEGSRVIGFYNLENLFDNIDDPRVNDEDFLPDGENEWTEEKYQMKLHNMASAIRAMADENGMYHSILGVAEVENIDVLNELIAQPELADAGFKAILEEGGDGRGIDVGLIYRPDVFKVKEVKSIPYDFEGSRIDFYLTKKEMRSFHTRDVLMVRGMLDGEDFAVFVAHLPSRLNDKPADLRNRGAEIIYNNAMALQKKYPGIKIVVMGDMNDDPTDESMTGYLMAKETREQTGDTDFFSPFISMLKAGYGSSEYRGDWLIFDQILVNGALANAPEGTLCIQPAEKGKYYGKIFNRPFLTQQDGRYAGTPFRTFSNGKFINGYSDHYPTFIIVSK